MKKLFSASLKILSLLLFLASCSPSNNDIIVIKEENTLKNQITEKEKTILWTSTIEEEILSTKIEPPTNLENIAHLSLELINSISTINEPCLPLIKEIGSLDNSDIPQDLVIFVYQVCNQIQKMPETGLNEYFHEDYLFNKTFFIYDLSQFYKSHFNEKYPKKNLFEKYYVGRIHQNFDLTEVGVRFYKRKKYVDIKLFISQNERKYNLVQIELL